MAKIFEPIGEHAIREELQELVLKDLLGPAGGPQEELTEKVRDRYLVGLIAPGKLQTDPDPEEYFAPEEQEELSRAGGDLARGGDEEGGADSATQQQISFAPSSIGITFNVSAAENTQLKVTARWGHYRRESSDALTKADGAPRLVWKRTQRQGTITVTLREGQFRPWQPEPEEQPQVIVRGIVRRVYNTSSNGSGSAGSRSRQRMPTGDWSVTLFLVNNQREPERNRDSAWLFQPELIIEAPSGQGDDSPIFRQRKVERQGYEGANPDINEQKAMQMLYRRRVNFAVGHGVGVHADTLPGDTTRAWRLSTRIVPQSEVPQTAHLDPVTASRPELAGLVLEMDELARLTPQEVETKLGPLTSGYGTWIAEQETRLREEADLRSYRQVGKEALSHCRATLARIATGISLLATSSEALEAFRFMNEAMRRQYIRSRLVKARAERQTLAESAVESPRWRPFQLGFILLNLPSLTDLAHPDRTATLGTTTPESSQSQSQNESGAGAIADLLWFPTGGGKTEAYLGLTAYTLAIRRLQGIVGGRVGEEGVAVIMRYTLRLLTLQQFQRAAALICACETIRRENPAKWGATPFRLGLWVGQRATPNTTAASEEALHSENGARGSVLGGVGTPRQLEVCPWCGQPVKLKVESFRAGRGRTFMHCGDPLGACPFSARQSPDEGLPVLVVDEEIYRFLPSLLIATVDKFAQMPWKGAVGLLFGQVSRKCERHGFVYPDPPSDSSEPGFHPAKPGQVAARISEHAPLRPPDLIIQDELHLISGPLGTLVGLYESAVDHLCAWQPDPTAGYTVRPKVIAATATVRRAERQIHALFLRKVSVFPPPGLDIGDNFFARQIEPSEATPGRRYIGICASGRRLKAALIRVYVAFLAAGQYLFEKYGNAADPYMTLVGYFNSLSDLGGTRRLVEDEVRTRLGRMAERGLADRRTLFLEELTSRRSSDDIPKLLAQLDRRFDAASLSASRGQGQRGSTGELGQGRLPALDVLLATNMISVGVDVSRLGLMVVTGQPKNTAEYIQATSRVGRQYPGLVCTVYNWARPRDLSHYEQFEHYHSTYYQYVEALSVTPFAARALDRGLAALLVSYVRHSGTDYTENAKAANFTATNPNFSLATAELGRRAQLVRDEAARALVQERLSELRDTWLRETGIGGRQLVYKAERGATVGLLSQPGSGEWNPLSFTCLNSLRDVEATVKLLLDERSLTLPVPAAGAAGEEGTGAGQILPASSPAAGIEPTGNESGNGVSE